MAQKHGPNTWENYLRVHENVLRQYSKYFVNLPITYAIEKITANYYSLLIERLEVKTSNGNIVFIKLEKDVDVQPGVTRKIARTYGYSYNCWKKVGGLKTRLIRYCSPHLDHNKFHHKHDFTVNPSTVTKIGNDEWPHVSDFLDEVISKF